MAEIALVDGVHGYRMDGIYPTVIVWDASRWNVVSDDIQTLFARLMGLERKDVHMHFLN